ncbi:MAG: HPr family phosphocarrier protein [Treponema sp.]|jgi:phosphocarrier protein|nr:HPr family phosphocarrier protein [Treponema sp.]
MVEQKVTVSNRAGVHARPAALLVQKINKFKSTIYLEKGQDRINAKSIMGVITLGAGYGTELTIKAEGEDEVQAVETLVRLFESKFEED